MKFVFLSLALILVSLASGQVLDQLKIAQEKEHNGDLRGALQIYNTVISEKPLGESGVAAYFYRGSYFRKKGDYERARKDFNQAARMADATGVDNDKLLYDLYFGRGLMRFSDHDYRGTIADMGKALQYKETASSYAYQGLSHYTLKHKKEACEAFSSALALNEKIVLRPAFAEAYKKTKSKCK